jgi:D-lactate dehydrogenase
MGAIARGARGVAGEWLPAWNAAMPRAAPATRLETIRRGKGRQVVYFPSCISRTMGAPRGDSDGRAIFEATLSLLGKADYDVIFPDALDSLCCGLAFDSKGFRDVADAKSEELERALEAASEGGRIPILCDTSPCLQRMRKMMDPKLLLLEPAEFIHDHLLDKLQVKKLPDKVAVHVTCSSTKMGVGGKLEAVARAWLLWLRRRSRLLPPGAERGRALRAGLGREGLHRGGLQQPHLRDRAHAPLGHPVPIHRLPGRPGRLPEGVR